MQYKLYFTDEPACARVVESDAMINGFGDTSWDIKGDLSNIKITDDIQPGYGNVISYQKIKIKQGFTTPGTVYTRAFRYWRFMIFCMEDNRVVKICTDDLDAKKKLEELIGVKEQLVLLSDDEELVI